MIKRGIALVRRLWAIQFLRFLVIGGVNTVVGYTVFAVLILLDVHYTIAALLTQICGAVFNFKTTGTLVFKNKSNRLIFRFIRVYLVTYLVNIGLLKIFNTYNVNNLIAQAILVLPIAVLSYFLFKRFVFRVV